MRTSFHHQPEAQHPIFQLSTSWQADYPIFWSEADMPRAAGACGSDENDPKRTKAGLKSRSAASLTAGDGAAARTKAASSALKRRTVDGRQRQFLSWWRIWVRSAELDRRIFLQAFRELSDDLHHRRDDP